MNNIWIYTIVFYKNTENGKSLREFMSFPFTSLDKANVFRKSFEERKNINKMFSEGYHWESIIEEKKIDDCE